MQARFAKAADAGEMLDIHDLKAADEKAIEHATCERTVYTSRIASVCERKPLCCDWLQADNGKAN